VLPWLSTFKPHMMDDDEFPGPVLTRPSIPESLTLLLRSEPDATADEATRFRVGPLLSTGFRLANSFFCLSISSRSLALSSWRLVRSWNA
jgi:hypothetical protein